MVHVRWILDFSFGVEMGLLASDVKIGGSWHLALDFDQVFVTFEGRQ